jgi:hypothetical protein
MKTNRLLPIALLVLLTGLALPARPDDAKKGGKEESLAAPNGLTIKVRMEGPYDADTPLQVVCYFRHQGSGDKTLGAAVELDKRLGGVIASLRGRGEFMGDEAETLLLTPPKDAIKPKLLLLVGLGDEGSLSLSLERMGRAALREAARLGVERSAIGPLIRDQGNSKLGTGDVERAVTRGLPLAYDTAKRLQRQGLARAFTLDVWSVEAGPDYFDETVRGIRKGIEEAKASAGK